MSWPKLSNWVKRSIYLPGGTFLKWAWPVSLHKWNEVQEDQTTRLQPPIWFWQTYTFMSFSYSQTSTRLPWLPESNSSNLSSFQSHFWFCTVYLNWIIQAFAPCLPLHSSKECHLASSADKTVWVQTALVCGSGWWHKLPNAITAEASLSSLSSILSISSLPRVEQNREGFYSSFKALFMPVITNRL